ncbi:hypothetical protein D3C80_1641260 [compost metagenome]
MDQQPAVAALLHEMLGGELLFLPGERARSRVVRGNTLVVGTGQGVQAASHRHGVIHRHRLGDQWTDIDHQHGEQRQPDA